MRVAARKDELHRGVGQIFRKHGWQTLDLSRVGDGVPDWLCIRRSLAILIEVKTPGAFRPGSKTLERQAEFKKGWTACAILTIESLWDAEKEAELFREPYASALSEAGMSNGGVD